MEQKENQIMETLAPAYPMTVNAVCPKCKQGQLVYDPRIPKIAGITANNSFAHKCSNQKCGETIRLESMYYPRIIHLNEMQYLHLMKQMEDEMKKKSPEIKEEVAAVEEKHVEKKEEAKSENGPVRHSLKGDA